MRIGITTGYVQDGLSPSKRLKRAAQIENATSY